MKKSEIMIIVIIVMFSAMLAYLVGQAVLGKITQAGVKVKSIDAISSKVVTPDPRIFNDKAVNPTVEINIGDSANQQPFGGTQ